MNDMQEKVDLPDPSEKALLHPTDIAQARPLYVRGWWFARLGSVPVAVALGAVTWLLSGNLIPTVLAPATTLVVGVAAGRWHTARAWDFVPRRRQLKTGVPGWRLGAACVDGVALVVAASAFVLAAHAHAIPLAVIVYATGAVVAVGLVQAVELAILASRTTARTDALPKAVMLAAVAASCLIAALLGIGAAWYQHLVWVGLLGAGTVVLAQALWSVFALAQKRRLGAGEQS
jgi:hypothetical protein